MNIGNKLKELRIEHDLSQAELGKKSNTTGACISSWERGRTEPNIGQINAIADFFDIPATSLLGEVTQNVELTANEINLIVEYRNADADMQKTIKRLLAYAQRIRKLNDLMKE